MVKFYENTFIVLGVNTSNDLLSSTLFEAPQQAGPSGVAPQPSTLQPPPPARVQNHPQLPQSDGEAELVNTENTENWSLFRKLTLDMINTKNKFLRNVESFQPPPSPFLSLCQSVCLSVCKDTINRRQHCQSREKAEDKQFE